MEILHYCSSCIPYCETAYQATDQQKQKLVKENICKNIFSSPFFEKRSEGWVNTDLNTVRKKLKNYSKSVYYDTTFRKPLKSSNSSRQYFNPYELKTTVYRNANGTVANENVFLCIVADSDSEQWFKEYYISREYNVNSVENAFPIVGRFIFSMNALQELKLEALAEESAILWDFVRRVKLTESFYLWQRNDSLTGESTSIM